MFGPDGGSLQGTHAKLIGKPGFLLSGAHHAICLLFCPSPRLPRTIRLLLLLRPSHVGNPQTGVRAQVSDQRTRRLELSLYGRTSYCPGGRGFWGEQHCRRLRTLQPQTPRRPCAERALERRFRNRSSAMHSAWRMGDAAARAGQRVAPQASHSRPTRTASEVKADLLPCRAPRCVRPGSDANLRQAPAGGDVHRRSPHNLRRD